MSSEGRGIEMDERHEEWPAVRGLRLVAMLSWMVGAVGLIVIAVVAVRCLT
jgi:hypothetical protein